MSMPAARLHSIPAAPLSPVQVAQAATSETLQMEPTARDNQQSMALKKIVAKCESDPATASMDHRSTCLSFQTFGFLNLSVGYDKRELLQGSALSSDNLSVIAEMASRALPDLGSWIVVPCNDATGYGKTAIQQFIFIV